MKNENQESVTDVLAEMHAFKNHPNARKTVKGTFVASILDGLARRIEAALKREAATAEKSSVVGNAKAMREALVETLDALKYLSRRHSGDLPEDVRVVLGKMAFDVNAALSTPPRQYDVGDAADWEKRFGEECDKGHICSDCPVRHEKTRMAIKLDKGARCEFVWAQMPYPEGNGHVL